MKTVQIDINGVVTGIRIDAADQANPRLILEGVQQDAATGATVRSFSEDVTSQLNPTQKSRITGIVTQAQAWIDAK